MMVSESSVHLSVVIPAYNEALRLPETLSHSIEYLKKQPYRSELIVVNDGSSDETEKAVQSLFSGPVPVKLLAHPDDANHGKGASVRLGMLSAGGTYRLFMDADNSASLDQIDLFWPLLDQGYEVVVGSRALKGAIIDAHQPRYKELAGRLGNWIIRVSAVPGIMDTQTGFKIFAGDKAEVIFSRQTIDRWGFDIELLAIARFHGFRIAEIPIKWANASGSKVTMDSYLEVLKDVWRIRRNLKAGIYK